MNARMKLIKTKMDLLDLYESERQKKDSLLLLQKIINVKESTLLKLEKDLVKEEEVNQIHEYNAWLLGVNIEELKDMYKL